MTAHEEGMLRCQNSECGEPVEVEWVKCPVCGTALTSFGLRRGTHRFPRPVVLPPANRSPGDHWTNPVDGKAMVWIPPGEFLMGSPVSEPGHTPRRPDQLPEYPDSLGDSIDDPSLEETQHLQRIEGGCWLDVAPVTNAEFRRFVQANPEWRQALANTEVLAGDFQFLREDDYRPAGDDDHPVACVSWHEARAYAAWAGKRLPTEAEWEYAARAGTRTARWWGDDFDASRAVGRGNRSTQPVGDPQRTNAWGLADILGNVWEWTSSRGWHYPYRTNDGREDPGESGCRVLRGGAWFGDLSGIRAASRVALDPRHCDMRIGFRCAQSGS